MATCNRQYQGETVKFQAFDSNYFLGKSYFKDNGTQIYLVFQPVSRYF